MSYELHDRISESPFKSKNSVSKLKISSKLEFAEEHDTIRMNYGKISHVQKQQQQVHNFNNDFLSKNRH